MTIEIDHTSLSVSDYEAGKKFYAAALKPLRVGVMMEFPASVTGNVDVCGLGADGKPFLWLANAGKTSPRVHIAFRAETRAQVNEFHTAAIAAGGKDNGAPGRFIIPTTTAHSCSMLTDTISKWSVTSLSDPEETSWRMRRQKD